MGNQQPSLVKRKCTTCNKRKTLDQFQPYVCRGKSLLQARCKACTAEWQRNYRRTRPDREEQLALARERSRLRRLADPAVTKAKAKFFHAKYRERDRGLIYEKYGGKCSCCGESNVKFITIDHINNDGCVQRKSGIYTNGSQFYRYVIQCGFPDEYRLLCYNCNLGRARNGGVCPHKEGSTIIPKGSRAKRPEVRRVPRGR